MRRYIISSAYGYEAEKIKNFVLSSKLKVPDAELIILYHEDEGKDADQLRQYRHDVTLVKPSDHVLRGVMKSIGRHDFRMARYAYNISKYMMGGAKTKKFGAISSICYGVALARYLWINDYCLTLDLKPDDRILLTDSRDVVFQRDIFKMAGGHEFATGLEDGTIGECEWNSDWILTCYGRDTLNKMAAEKIICSGVTVGRAEEILAYLRLMSNSILNLGERALMVSGLDQAVHNFLIRQNKLDFPVDLTAGTDGLIATLQWADPQDFSILPEGELKIDTCIPAIVHQYDRHPALLSHFDQLYSRSGEDSLLQ